MTLTRNPRDLGILHVLTVEATRTHVPRLLRLLESVNAGVSLQSHEIHQIRMALESTLSLESFLRFNPDYREYYSRQVDLLHGIITKAIDNQQDPGGF